MHVPIPVTFACQNALSSKSATSSEAPLFRPVVSPSTSLRVDSAEPCQDVSLHRASGPGVGFFAAA